MILRISLHSGMTTQTAVSLFDLDLYFTGHQLCKFAWCDIASGRILVLFIDQFFFYFFFVLTRITSALYVFVQVIQIYHFDFCFIWLCSHKEELNTK